MSFVLAAEILGERSGVANIGVEGQMLVGAACGFAVTVQTTHPWLGLLGGACAGVLLSALHAYLCLVCRASQVTSGVAVLTLGAGLSSYFGSNYVGKQINGFDSLTIPGLSVHWTDVFRQITPTMAISVLVPILLGGLLFYTRFGLRLRSVGESPQTARIFGLNPSGYRWAALLGGGFLSGLGGAALSVDYTKGWSEGMTEGRGLVAVGLVALTRWNPFWITPVAMIFGASECTSLLLQSRGVPISPYMLALLPYLVPIAVLAINAKFFRSRDSMPASLREIFILK